MKKLISLLLVVALAFCVFALVACTEPCTEHIDVNPKDGKCDNCGKDMPAFTEHIDVNPKDGKCDKCGADVQTEPTKETLNAESLVKGVWQSPVYGDATHQLQDYIAFHDNGIFFNDRKGAFQPIAGNWTYSAADAGTKATIVHFEKPEGATEEVDQSYDIDVEGWVTLKTFAGEPIVCTHDGVDYFTDGKYPIAFDSEFNQYTIYGLTYRDFKCYHVADKAHSFDDETLIVVDEFVSSESDQMSVKIGHNGKFEDIVTVNEQGKPVYYEGNWTYNEQTKTYTLTSEKGTATLVVSEDGATATYKRGSAQEITLLNKASVKETSKVFQGEVATGVMGEIRLYEDGSCDLVVAGNPRFKDGTWSVSGGVYTVKFNELPTALTSTTNGDDLAVITLNMGSGEISFVEVKDREAQIRFTGHNPMVPGVVEIDTEILLYNDNSATLKTTITTGAKVDEEGTWTLNPDYSMTITIPVEDGEDRVFTATYDGEAKTYKFVYSFEMQGQSGPTTVSVNMTRVEDGPAE